MFSVSNIYFASTAPHRNTNKNIYIKKEEEEEELM